MSTVTVVLVMVVDIVKRPQRWFDGDAEPDNESYHRPAEPEFGVPKTTLKLAISYFIMVAELHPKY